MHFLKSIKIHTILVNEHRTLTSTAGVQTAVYSRYKFLGSTKCLNDIAGGPTFLLQIQNACKFDSTKAEITVPSPA
jgi:hypothetical protein